jgi:chromosome segregation ATPase
VPWWTWLAFGIFLLALVATAVFSAFAFGRLKRIGAAVEGIQARVDEVARAAEEVERKMAHAQERLEELDRHRAVLAGSLARLKVLTDAFSEATGRPRKARGRYLRK